MHLIIQKTKKNDSLGKAKICLPTFGYNFQDSRSGKVATLIWPKKSSISLSGPKHTVS